MHNRARIVTSTALALLMATPHVGASPQQAGVPRPVAPEPVLTRTMADGAAHESLLLLAQAADEEEVDEEEPRRRQAEEAGEEEPPADDAEPEPEEPAEQDAPAEPEPQPEPETEPAAEEPETPAEEAPAEPEPQPETEPAEPEQPAEEDVQQPAEAEDEPAPQLEERPAPAEQEAQPPAQEESEPLPEETRPPVDRDAEPPIEEDAGPPTEGEIEDEAEPLPEETEPPLEEEAPLADGESAIEPGSEAPLLDSQKDEATGQAPEAEADGQPVEAVEEGPPPTSDEEAQQLEEPVEVQSLRAEEGRRVEQRGERRERREGTNVLREIGDRIVIQLNNQVVVQSDDRDRIGRDASEVYYEELPRGRTRETVVRPNGVQIVTVYDRYGDVVSRSRFMPDGREHVLVYADRRDREERRQWRDPGLDLPPLRLRIPAEEYILDAGRVRDEQIYYDFLNQPPVEPVRRLYSVDEVRYSARVRDSVRRIELDTITFDFGSASISENTIPALAGVAHAMEQLLDQNPAEVFLIEGHTDAVGSQEANLALSDRRAEGVAMALTNVFGIPPENMVTQGYGKRYLKINTQEPERQNRRVVMRRITPLVAPVAGLQ